MEITNEIIADHTALWFTEQSILSFADFHLGYEEELFRKGVHVPLNEFKHQRALFSSLIKKYEPRVIVLNGDIKHTFGGINTTEWRHTLELLDMLTANSTVVIIKGNHDIILEPVARKKGIEIVDHYRNGKVLFIHGDVEPKEEWLRETDTVVMGHEHPAIGLTNGVRTELYKCFLKLAWKKKALIIQPSTFSLTTGTDVLAKQLHNDWFGSVAKAEVFVMGEEGNVFCFGKLNKI